MGGGGGHLCLCVFPSSSTWLCCAPRCASETQHLRGQASPQDAEDIPLGAQRRRVTATGSLFTLFDCEAAPVPAAGPASIQNRLIGR